MTYRILTGSGNSLSDAERAQFIALVELGGAITDLGQMRLNVQRAPLLCMAYAGDLPVACIAAKIPNPTYVRRISAECGVNLATYTLELGYMHILPPHRNRILASSIADTMLAATSHDGLWLTTLQRPGAQRWLGSRGFTSRGCYTGSRHQTLELFTRNPICV